MIVSMEMGEMFLDFNWRMSRLASQPFPFSLTHPFTGVLESTPGLMGWPLSLASHLACGFVIVPCFGF